MSEIDKQLKENIGMFYVHAVVENDVRVKIIAIRRLLGSLLTAAKQKNDILNIKTIAVNINKLETCARNTW